MDKYKEYAQQKEKWLEKLPEVLSGLTEKQRRRLYLRFWVDWSYRAIAEWDGLSKQGVHRCIKRALRQIRGGLTNTKKGKEEKDSNGFDPS